MECLSFLLLVALAVALVVGWQRAARRFEAGDRRLGEVELELGRLRTALERLQGGPLEAPPVEQPSPAETREPTEAPEVTISEPPELPMPSPAEAAPPTSTPAASPPTSPPSPPSPPGRGLGLDIDWERWVGVRGAAVLGGIVLALAAILFLRYAIEHGLISPTLRVVIGILAGLGSVSSSEALRRRAYEATANALAGAGVVILYAALWSASRLYGLIPTALAYVCMIVVTAACGVLAWRHRSLVIAVLGLAGGYLTPVLLATGFDHPIGLFGYILLLNTGLLILAHRRGWPLLAALGLAGTVVYQASWVATKMQPGLLVLGLAILAIFAALYAAAGSIERPDESSDQRRAWVLSQAAGILVPFAFALYFASRADLGRHLWSIAVLLVALSVAADWIGRRQEAPLLRLGAAAADLAVVLVWIGRVSFDQPLAWEATALCLVLALCFHLPLEASRRRKPEAASEGAAPALLSAAGFVFLLLVAAVTNDAPLGPWLAGWAALAGILLRQSLLPGLAWIQVVAAGGLGLGLAAFFVAHRLSPILPEPLLFFGLAAAAAAAFQPLALVRREAEARRQGNRAAAVVPALLLLSLLVESGSPRLEPALYFASTLVLALLVVLAASRLPSGALFFAAMALLAAEHRLWSAVYAGLEALPGTVLLALGAQLAAVALFSFWPFLVGRKFTQERWAWYAAALAGPVWFFSLKELFETRFGDAAIGVLPLLLGALALAAAFRARRFFVTDHPRRKSALAWFAAVALGFVSIAIPLQLEKEWITIGWALEGLAVIALWKRLDHPGLKYFGLALLGAASVRLVANPSLLSYYPSSGWPIVNWLAYTYLVPAAALLGSATLLRRLEVERRLEWEASVYARGYPLGAMACGVAAIVVIFVWINLTIFDFFSPGRSLYVSFEHLPARDLTLSLAWAVYALILLALGMVRGSQGLRWLSLVFLVLTIGKVFLHDLGELQDLYRVGSLVGLAASLILVSLGYQRLVFRQDSGDKD